MPWLLIARPWNPATDSVVELYLSDVGFVTEPGDTPSNTYFDRRIEIPLSGTRSLFNGSDIGGESETTLGEIVCINEDGALDGWLNYEWGGRKVELLYSGLEEPLLSDFTIVATHTVQSITVSNSVAIRFSDAKAFTEKPYQTNLFLGTGGSEGATVLKDTRKPRSLGFPIQVEPPVVDDVNRIVVVGDGPIGGVLRLLDRGVELVAGPDYADESAMLSASFGAAGFLTCYALGILRLANPAVGPMTADLAGRTRGSNLHSGGSASTVAGRWYVLRAMVTRLAGSVQPTVAGSALGAAVATTRHIVRSFLATGSATSIAFPGDGSWSGSVTNIEVIEVLTRAGDLIEWIVDTDTDLNASDFESGTVSALNVLCPQPLQHWHPMGSDNSVDSVITEIASTVGAWWGASLSNKIELGLFDGPAASADFTFTDREIFDFTPQDAASRIWKFEIRFSRRWRKLEEGDVAGSVTGDARTYLLVEYESAFQEDTDIKTEALNAEEFVFDSLFIRRVDAENEALRRLNLFGAAPKPARVVVPFTENLDIGSTVHLSWPRFGLGGGALFVVLQAERDFESNEIPTNIITVWR